MRSSITSGRQLRWIVVFGLLIPLPLMLSHQGNSAPVPHLRNHHRSWPTYGGSPGRNMVNTRERNLPTTWCIKKGKRKNIKWVATLGDQTHGSPVVANGKVFVGTNDAYPRASKVKGPQPIMLAFRELDGKFLWKIVHRYPATWTHPSRSTAGVPSPPTVDGRKLYYVTPPCEVICVNASNGTISWRYDMMKNLRVYPCRYFCDGHSAPTLPTPLVVGNLLFVATGNGLNFEGKLVSPSAPNFVAFDKTTGKIVWQSNIASKNTVEGQWSCPVPARTSTGPQVIFVGGDRVIYSFAPKTGKLLWKCNCLPKPRKKGKRGMDPYIVSTPVVVGEKLYIGLGLLPYHPRGCEWSYFLCLDITRRGDVSLKSYHPNDARNKHSALVWAFGGPVVPRPRDVAQRVAYFGSTLSTAAIHDGLVYITEEYGYLHCLDAKTGNRYWQHDLRDAVISSPYWVDGRIFVCTDGGDVVVLNHGRKKRVRASFYMDDSISTTPVAANGTLYITTRSKLYAISSR